ncbi:hypothetical protein SALBM135S_00994 [Streptomyces alboniger]
MGESPTSGASRNTGSTGSTGTRRYGTRSIVDRPLTSETHSAFGRIGIWNSALHGSRVDDAAATVAATRTATVAKVATVAKDQAPTCAEEGGAGSPRTEWRRPAEVFTGAPPVTGVPAHQGVPGRRRGPEASSGREVAAFSSFRRGAARRRPRAFFHLEAQLRAGRPVLA